MPQRQASLCVTHLPQHLKLQGSKRGKWMHVLYPVPMSHPREKVATPCLCHYVLVKCVSFGWLLRFLPWVSLLRQHEYFLPSSFLHFLPSFLLSFLPSFLLLFHYSFICYVFISQSNCANLPHFLYPFLG